MEDSLGKKENKRGGVALNASQCKNVCMVCIMYVTAVPM